MSSGRRSDRRRGSYSSTARRSHSGGRRADRRRADRGSSRSSRRPRRDRYEHRYGDRPSYGSHRGSVRNGRVADHARELAREYEGEDDGADGASASGGTRRDASDDSAAHDDSVGTYDGRAGDYILSRYKILREAGVGTFGRVLECVDKKRNLIVAIKVVRKVDKYTESAKVGTHW